VASAVVCGDANAVCFCVCVWCLFVASGVLGADKQLSLGFCCTWPALQPLQVWARQLRYTLPSFGAMQAEFNNCQFVGNSATNGAGAVSLAVSRQLPADWLATSIV
jgi:hypothetical protein